MGTIGDAIRQRRSVLRAGVTGLALNAALILLIAAFLVVLLQRVVEHGPSFFLQILAFALANGGIYALIALGYTMVYGIIELINFAHGDVFAFGAFLSASIIPVVGLAEGQSFGVGSALGLLVVFVVTMFVCGVLNVSIERIAYRPLRNAPRLAPLITAVGVSFFLEGALFLWRALRTSTTPTSSRARGSRSSARRSGSRRSSSSSPPSSSWSPWRSSSTARDSGKPCARPRRTVTPRCSWGSTSTRRSPRRSSSAPSSRAPAGPCSGSTTTPPCSTFGSPRAPFRS